MDPCKGKDLRGGSPQDDWFVVPRFSNTLSGSQRGLVRDDADCGSDPVMSGSGRAAASDAAQRQAAESAQADFAFSQRRIHSLQRADGTMPDQVLTLPD
jgi:hypothetical protein